MFSVQISGLPAGGENDLLDELVTKTREVVARIVEEGEGLVGRGDWMGPSHKQWRGWEGQGVEGEKGAPSQGRVNSQV